MRPMVRGGWYEKLLQRPHRTGSMDSVRRLASILLVCMFGFSLILPALSVDAAANLPVCCRRTGSHHCGMSAEDSAPGPSSVPLADALRFKCPFFPGSGAVVPNAGAAVLSAFAATGVPVLSRFANTDRRAAGYRFTSFSSHCKRGPPGLLS